MVNICKSKYLCKQQILVMFGILIEKNHNSNFIKSFSLSCILCIHYCMLFYWYCYQLRYQFGF